MKSGWGLDGERIGGKWEEGRWGNCGLYVKLRKNLLNKKIKKDTLNLIEMKLEISLEHIGTGKGFLNSTPLT